MNRARILKKVLTRIYILFASLFCLSVIISGQLVHLQIIQGPGLAKRAKTQYQKIKEVTPGRGNIYDRHGRELALSIPVESVAAVPIHIENHYEASRLLGQILGVPASQLRSRLDSERHFAWLKRKVDDQSVQRVRELGLEGIIFRGEAKRLYPKGYLAGQILGFTGLDNQGLGGVEASLDRFLNGHPGRILWERDCFGRSFIPAERVLRDPSGGNDVFLTIDQVIQFIAEKELNRGLIEEKASGGTTIVMDVKTGEILAMALAPPFNPNDYSNRRLRNYPALSKTRAATDSLEPGSTIKSLVVASALDLGIIRPSTVINCGNGSIRVKNHVFKDWKPFGLMTVREIVQNSSDVGAIRIGQMLGRERLEQYFRAFGLESKTGIELYGEDRGKLPEYWSSTSLAAVSFGYEIMVTPIQLITAFSVFAADGYLIKPRILKRVCGHEGKVIMETRPKRIRRVIQSSTATMMVDILEKVVEEGTGVQAAIPGVSVAGKTGTVEIYDQESGTYLDKLNRTLFVGFFPSRPDPELAILVIIDEPKIHTFGGSAAAPVFSRIAGEIYRYRESRLKKNPRNRIGVEDLYISTQKVRDRNVF
jgi:cell division protein FtsI (penicillin-binding protein 3)